MLVVGVGGELGKNFAGVKPGLEDGRTGWGFSVCWVWRWDSEISGLVESGTRYFLSGSRGALSRGVKHHGHLLLES